MPNFITIKFVVQNRGINWDWGRPEFKGLIDRAESIIWEVLEEHSVAKKTISGKLLIPHRDSYNAVVVFDEAFAGLLDDTTFEVTPTE